MDLTAELADRLRAATGARARLRVAGAGTRGRWGTHVDGNDDAVPVESLDTTPLDAVVAYAPDDLTVTVQAGVPVAELVARLADDGLELPGDAGRAGGAGRAGEAPGTVDGGAAGTVGGLVARAHGGRTPARSVRSAVLGARHVTGAGTVARSGGRVVKNVSGYDLHRFLAGSAGTLAVLAELTLRLVPAPPRRRAWVLTADDPLATARRVRRELPVAEAVWAHADGTVTVLAAGDPDDLDAAARRLGGPADAPDAWPALPTDPGGHADVWCDPARLPAVVSGAGWWHAEASGFVRRAPHGFTPGPGDAAEHLDGDGAGRLLTPWAPPAVAGRLEETFDPAGVLPKLRPTEPERPAPVPPPGDTMTVVEP